jgi:hypothetical protein
MVKRAYFRLSESPNKPAGTEKHQLSVYVDAANLIDENIIVFK